MADDPFPSPHPEPWPSGPPVIGPPPPRQVDPSSGPAGPISPTAPGAPPAPPAPSAPGPTRRRGRLVLLAAAVVVLLVVGAAVVVLARQGGSDLAAVPIGEAEGPATTPEELWSAEPELDGISTVAAGTDVVFVTTDHALLTAYDAGSGDELWSMDLEDARNSFPARPLGADHVLVNDGGDDDSTRLVEARSGEVVWEAEGEPPVIYRDRTSADALAVHDLDIVLLRIDGRVDGVDRETGDLLWSVSGAQEAAPCDGVIVLATGGSRGYSLPTGVTAVDPVSGEELWSAEGPPGQCRGGEVAVAVDGAVTIRAAATGTVVDELDVAEDEPHVVAVAMDDTVLVQQAHTEDRSLRVALYPRAGGDPVFTAEGVLATPVGADSVLVVPNDDVGEGITVDAATGEERGRLEVDRTRYNECGPVTTPTILVVCSGFGSEVTAVGIDDGAPVWDLTVAQPESDRGLASADVAGDRLFVTTRTEVIAYG